MREMAHGAPCILCVNKSIMILVHQWTVDCTWSAVTSTHTAEHQLFFLFNAFSKGCTRCLCVYFPHVLTPEIAFARICNNLHWKERYIHLTRGFFLCVFFMHGIFALLLLLHFILCVRFKHTFKFENIHRPR